MVLLLHIPFSAPFDLLLGRRDLFRCFSAHLLCISLRIPWAPGTPAWVIIQATGQKIIVYVAVLGLLVESLLLPEVLRTGAYTHEPSTSPSRQATGESSGGE